MNLLIVAIIVALALINFWILKRVLKRKSTPKSALESLAQQVAEQEGDTTILDSKSIPNASGPYGLSPMNPICCGNMARMKFVYERIYFNGTAVSLSLESEATLVTKHHVRRCRHNSESGIPDIFFSYDFYYEDCRNEHPEMPGFTMK